MNDLDLYSVHEYLTNRNITLEYLDDLKKHKVLINKDDIADDEIWILYYCLYASILIDSMQYVIYNGKIYLVNQKFYQDYETEYRNLLVYRDFPKININQSEEAYNKQVSESNTKYVLLDKDLIREKRQTFEVCDIFDIEQKAFINLKKIRNIFFIFIFRM